jgi:isocitrate/isopropylmalate dehydrogenase
MSAILCGAMLLDHLGLDAGQRIRDAVAAAFRSGETTLDAFGAPRPATTAESTIVKARL